MSKEEFDFLRANARLCREIGMEAFGGATVKRGNQTSEGVEVDGVTPNMAAIKQRPDRLGRYLSESGHRPPSERCVHWQRFEEKFFPNVDPVGKTLDVRGVPFEVIGVAKPRGSVFGQSRDEFVVIPVTTYFQNVQLPPRPRLQCAGSGRAHLEQAQDEIRSLLRAYRHLRPGQDDNFGMMSSDSLVNLWIAITGAIAATAVAVVSVFHGGGRSGDHEHHAGSGHRAHA